MKIYLVSSWRNCYQPAVLKFCRDLGHEVYDFRNPKPGQAGFSWDQIDPNWKSWTPEQYLKALNSNIAEEGYWNDQNALNECDACILVQPCGTSSHLELGFACGMKKKTAVLFPFGFEATKLETPCYPHEKLNNIEPELMVKMASAILLSKSELNSWLISI